MRVSLATIDIALLIVALPRSRGQRLRRQRMVRSDRVARQAGAGEYNGWQVEFVHHDGVTEKSVSLTGKENSREMDDSHMRSSALPVGEALAWDQNTEEYDDWNRFLVENILSMSMPQVGASTSESSESDVTMASSPIQMELSTTAPTQNPIKSDTSVGTGGVDEEVAVDSSATTTPPTPLLPSNEEPSLTPTESPVGDVIVEDTASPTVTPTNIPSSEPTKPFSPQPIQDPTTEPVEPSTSAPTTRPTSIPTLSPSFKPTFKSPTSTPTSKSPTLTPASINPTLTLASINPTSMPASINPTLMPASINPTLMPASINPTLMPASINPTLMPASINPTSTPASITPTLTPTSLPPTLTPTQRPTLLPSDRPTTAKPTMLPTVSPSIFPTPTPTSLPTSQPTASNSELPTFAPTLFPSDPPTQQPFDDNSIVTADESEFDNPADSAGQTAPSTTSPTPNIPPQAIADDVFLEIDVIVAMGNVLANDIDEDGDELTVVALNDSPLVDGLVSVVTKSGALLTISQQGSYTYDRTDLSPVATVTSECFSYTVTDGNGGFDKASLCVELEAAAINVGNLAGDGPTYPACDGFDAISRASALMEIVIDISDLGEDGSPQREALRWLTYEDAYGICPQNRSAVVQRYSMAVFYYSTDGPEWVECAAQAASDAGDLSQECYLGRRRSHKWLSPVHECEWGGLKCFSSDKSVFQIEFEGNGLGGTLPTELQVLSRLKYLYLEEGTISGTIPSEYGRLKKLVVLDLDKNNLNGEIPTEIFSLPKLEQLDINENKLSGTISTYIGKMARLRFLQISQNELVGTIPTEVGALVNLERAFFEDNYLVGTMPEDVCQNWEMGMLAMLEADCLPDSDPKVECSCCSECH